MGSLLLLIGGQLWGKVLEHLSLLQQELQAPLALVRLYRICLPS